MSPTAIFVLGIIGSGLVTIAGIYAVALRRGPSAGPVPTEERRKKRATEDGRTEPV